MIRHGERRVPKRGFAALALAMALGALASTLAAAEPSDRALAAQHRAEAEIAARYSQVRQMPIAEAQLLLGGTRPVVLLDVREADEFAVSHLRGARRIDPEASAQEVLRTIGRQPRQATILLYCTIGTRSSRMAQRIETAFGGASGPAIASLRGGVIAWANAGLPLVDSHGETRNVHPFDASRANMLADPSRVRGHSHGLAW